MGYLAIARKWRPSKFEDLVGQGHVVQTLRNAISQNRVSHAYLFSGARGIGKTSVARIFAKALRCPNVKEGMPCNECEECQAITESRSVDVVEIDGASNNGVEAVRGIRENVAYSASSGHYKIYIIDEVHMLSISAFNALLKTLEEPPSHIIFVFATTEVQKIPLTILSRCQRFEFRRLTQAQIVARLREILAAEGFAIADAGLITLASQADGSLRDALSLLDQALSYCGGDQARGMTLDEKTIVAALGVHEASSVTRFWETVIAEDTSGIVALIADNYLAGVDLKHFAERCLEELRLLYLAVISLESRRPLTAEELDISAHRFGELQKMAQGLSVIRVERMAQILAKTVHQLTWSTLPRFLLEMAAIRMSKLKELSALESRPREPQSASAPRPPVAVAPPPTAATPPAPAAIARPAAPPPVSDAEEPEEELEEPAPVMRTAPAPPPPSSSSATGWKGFVEAVMKKRPLLGALLCHANFQMENEDGKKKVIVSFAQGSFYERQAQESKNRADIEEMIKSFFGRESLFQLSSADPTSVDSIERQHQEATTLLKKNALEHPAVLQAKQILGADVVGVNVEN